MMSEMSTHAGGDEAHGMYGLEEIWKLRKVQQTEKFQNLLCKTEAKQIMLKV